jgi:hypothetical protein
MVEGIIYNVSVREREANRSNVAESEIHLDTW